MEKMKRIKKRLSLTLRASQTIDESLSELAEQMTIEDSGTMDNEPFMRNGRPPTSHSMHSFLHQYTGSFKKPPLRRPHSVIGGTLGSFMAMPRNGSRLGVSAFSLSREFRVTTSDHCPHVDLAQFLRRMPFLTQPSQISPRLGPALHTCDPVVRGPTELRPPPV
ncbi:Cyclin-dependent kinase 17 [Channa argus]|uniref:Cyclin-dependent kinase 17 n=1 Tax=Channa argus TaxID=215402 RepID=A0A6G1QS92_CHAAH|nr:Cyclin-dependent kinase 17 [Channa argus]